MERTTQMNPTPIPERQRPQTREEVLALDLAAGLGDMKALPLYLAYARKYPEFLLRKVMSEVRQVPAQLIKKSRGALFNYMIQQYGKHESDGPRD